MVKPNEPILDSSQVRVKKMNNESILVTSSEVKKNLIFLISFIPFFKKNNPLFFFYFLFEINN